MAWGPNLRQLLRQGDAVRAEVAADNVHRAGEAPERLRLVPQQHQQRRREVPHPCAQEGGAAPQNLLGPSTEPDGFRCQKRQLSFANQSMTYHGAYR